MAYDAVFAGDNGESYKAYLLDRIHFYLNRGVKQVLVIGQIPTWAETLPHTLAKQFVMRHQPIPQRTIIGVDPLSLTVDRQFNQYGINPSVKFLSMKDFLCNSQGCITKVGPNIKQDLLYIDGGHLTPSGADYVTKGLLLPYLP